MKVPAKGERHARKDVVGFGILALLRRDLRMVLRRPGDSLVGIAFFVLALTLFPLGVGASPDVLARIGSGVIWVLALLAVLLGLEGEAVAKCARESDPKSVSLYFGMFNLCVKALNGLALGLPSNPNALAPFSSAPPKKPDVAECH